MGGRVSPVPGEMMNSGSSCSLTWKNRDQIQPNDKGAASSIIDVDVLQLSFREARDSSLSLLACFSTWLSFTGSILINHSLMG